MSYSEISFQNPYAFWVTTGCMMMLCGLLWKRLLSILFSSLTRSPPPRRLTPPTSSHSRGRWQHSTNDHQLKTSNLYIISAIFLNYYYCCAAWFSNKAAKPNWNASLHLCAYKKCKIVDTLSWGTVKFGQDRNGRSEKKYVTIYSNCSDSVKDSWFVSYYAHMPTRNAKLLTPSVGGQWNLGEIGRSAARKSMLLFHTTTVVKVLRIVGLSLITLTCLQEVQNCWHPQLGDSEIWPR